MNISNKHIYCFFAIVFLFSSWIIFYTIPRELQYPFFFAPAVLLILYKYHPYKRKNVIAFILFGIVLFRYSLPQEIDIRSLELYASFIRSIVIASIFLIDKKDLIKIYKYFVIILAPILLVSLVFYLLKTLDIVQMAPITRYVSEGGEGRAWNVYYLFSLQDMPYRGEVIRFPGIFDEPGYLGTLLAFILAIEKLDLSSWKNKIFLFCGILTFSLAFYLLLLSYFFLSVHIQLRYKVYAATIGFVMLAIGVLFFQDVFQDRVYERIVSEQGLELAQDGRVGIARQEITIRGLANLPPKELLLGKGYDAGREEMFGTSLTWERLVLQLGLLFTSFFILLILFFSSHSKQTLLFALIFIASLLQRPAIFAPIWFFIMLVGIYADDIKPNGSNTGSDKSKS